MLFRKKRLLLHQRLRFGLDWPSFPELRTGLFGLAKAKQVDQQHRYQILATRQTGSRIPVQRNGRFEGSFCIMHIFAPQRAGLMPFASDQRCAD